MTNKERYFHLKVLEEEVRSNQPAINALNDHHEQLQSFVNPMGANETNKQNTNLNNNWNTIKDKVEHIEFIFICNRLGTF